MYVHQQMFERNYAIHLYLLVEVAEKQQFMLGISTSLLDL